MGTAGLENTGLGSVDAMERMLLGGWVRRGGALKARHQQEALLMGVERLTLPLPRPQSRR